MNLQFNISKAVAASALLCKRAGGSIDVLYLVKMLYWADREALLRWQRPITGDSFYALPLGPIVSRTYDLMRGRILGGAGSDQAIWYKTFARREGHAIRVIDDPDDDPLSERETELLNKAYDTLARIPSSELIDFLHRILPEWKDPSGSSFEIKPETLFYNAGWDEESVKHWECELEIHNAARAAFS